MGAPLSVRRSGPGAKRLVVALKDIDGLEARTGWFETAKDAQGVPVATKAAAHEFGTARIPARPFMRPTVAAKKQAWLGQLAQGSKAILRGEATPRQVLEGVALRAAGDVAKTIKTVNSPPLSPKTVKRKGFAKPLVETGQMIQSVTGVVEKAKT